jgi:hypothetical protein
MRKGTLALSWGDWGGFYVSSSRVCLGWVAITWLPIEIDELVRAWLDTPRVPSTPHPQEETR